MFSDGVIAPACAPKCERTKCCSVRQSNVRWIMDDISALQQLTDEATKGDAHIFDIRPAVAWINDYQKATFVEGKKPLRGTNPARGTAISYWLKSVSEGDLKITISDVSGRTIRNDGRDEGAGMNRVQWNLSPQQTARGFGTPRPTPSDSGPQTPAQPAGGRGAQPAQPAAQPAVIGGRRGGLQPSVPPGTYLVKITISDKVIGQKTVTVEADRLQ